MKNEELSISIRIPKHVYVDDGSGTMRQKIMNSQDFFKRAKESITLLQEKYSH